MTQFIQEALMPCGWEGNRRSGVALPCVTDFSYLSTYALTAAPPPLLFCPHHVVSHYLPTVILIVIGYLLLLVFHHPLTFSL